MLGLVLENLSAEHGGRNLQTADLIIGERL
jgi:hypothetical protein